MTREQNEVSIDIIYLPYPLLENIYLTICLQLSFRFGTFEYLKGKSVDEKGNLSPMMRLVCGLGAGKRPIYIFSNCTYCVKEIIFNRDWSKYCSTLISFCLFRSIRFLSLISL
uniref:Uncharacterized protein n=1 Tax=Heterorhabditis bacteriophora TaxID=37862 RepID=A0A1I7XBE9_HETBA